MSQTPTTDEDDEESKTEGDNGGNVVQAGRALDQAETFIDDFIQSHVDLVPNVSGKLLYFRGEKR